MTFSAEAAAPLPRFEANPAGRDFVVGDIHGCFTLLVALLERTDFDPGRDRLFSVGDLIDRGPESEQALEWLAQPWFHAIRGNHEQMLIDGLRDGGEARRLWQTNGGDWFDALPSENSASWIAACKGLPLAIEVELGQGRVAGLAHADTPDDWAMVQRALQSTGFYADLHDPPLAGTLLWARRRAGEIERRRRHGTSWWRRSSPVAVDNIDVVFFGHTPMPAPTRCANTRWLDTGAFMGHALTLAELRIDGGVWSLAADRSAFNNQWQYVDEG